MDASHCSYNSYSEVNNSRMSTKEEENEDEESIQEQEDLELEQKEQAKEDLDLTQEEQVKEALDALEALESVMGHFFKNSKKV